VGAGGQSGLKSRIFGSCLGCMTIVLHISGIKYRTVYYRPRNTYIQETRLATLKSSRTLAFTLKAHASLRLMPPY
jgi:hypothetical protein